MVKAIKRKTAHWETKEEERKEKKKRFSKQQIFILLILILIVTGFTLNVPNLGSKNEPENPDAPVEPEFYTGSFVGSQEAEVGVLTGNTAIYGQLDVPTDLANRLEGDLFFLDNGLSQLILTNASSDYIKEKASGEYIIYSIASCGEFDCLIEEIPNGTAVFDVYELNGTSDFLKTSSVGFASSTEAIEI